MFDLTDAQACELLEDHLLGVLYHEVCHAMADDGALDEVGAYDKKIQYIIDKLAYDPAYQDPNMAAAMTKVLDGVIKTSDTYR